MVRTAVEFQEEFRPRIIVWQLTRRNGFPGHGADMLTRDECLRIIDGIARLSKPIVVFTGTRLAGRPDLHEIVKYGNMLNLKVIVELQPDEITEPFLEKFQNFGPRTFRLILDNTIVEDGETRYSQSPEFRTLEHAIRLLQAGKYEIHFSLTVTQPAIRPLSFNIDYAFRSGAKGLYCHLRFDKTVPEITIFDDEVSSLDEFIGTISELKSFVPNDMYLSPQCVKYSLFPPEEQLDFDFSDQKHPRWIHQCLAGKTFAFIDEVGKVYLCSGMCNECGDLREENYDFKKIWNGSDVLRSLREYRRSCVQTRLLFKHQQEGSAEYQREMMNQEF